MMQRHYCRNIITGILSFVIAPAMLAAASPAGHAEKSNASTNTYEYANVASHYLNQMHTQAMRLRASAEQLEAQNRENLDWRTETYLMNHMASRVRKIGRMMYSLQNIREEASPRQQRTIARIAPQVGVLASTTNGALHYLTNHHDRLWTENWHGYGHELYKTSNHLARTLRNSTEFARLTMPSTSTMKSTR